MRPRRLELENVGPFVGKVVVDFDALGDIFLISGKTGSGKTTVFDSLCYALYGNLPGGRRSLTRRLRSDFAPEGEDCSVALEFELGGSTYRVERKPPRPRRKTRGDGWTEDPETAVLFRKGAHSLEALSGKKSDADERIASLIGLSFDEFSKIVLLPQGEFAEFLKQNSNERREVLKKLFPVDHAVRVRELVSERAKEASARLLEAERALAEATLRFPVDSYEKLRGEGQAALEAAEADSKRLEAERDRLADELKTAEAELETRKALKEASESERRIEERAEGIARDEAALRRSRIARPLATLASRAEESAASAAVSAIGAAEAERVRADRAEKLAEAERRVPDVEVAEMEIARLRERRGPLSEAVLDETELARLKSEIAEFDARKLRAAGELASAEKLSAAREEEEARLRAKAETVDDLDARWESARTAMERARALKPLAERAGRLVRDRDAAADLRDRLVEETERRRADEPVLRAEIEGLERLVQTFERNGAAASLASMLLPGAPCPVCGSLDHPHPAAAPAPGYDIRDRLALRRRNAEDAAKTLAAKTAELASQEALCSRHETELGEIREQASAYSDSLPSAEEASLSLSALSEAVNAANAPRMEARKARDRLDALYREAKQADEVMAGIRSTLSDIEAKLAALRSAVGEKERRRDGILEAFVGSDTAVAALAGVDRRLAELESSCADWKRAREEGARGLAAAAAAAKAAEDAGREAAKTADIAAAEFAQALARSPFADERDLRSSLLGDAEEERVEREAAAWREDRSRARARREELEKALARAAESRGSGGLDELRKAAERNKLEREAATAARDVAVAAQRSLESGKAAYEDAEGRRANLAEEGRVLRALSDDLSGNNPKKRSFDAWLLGAYLREVAAFATKRLERMSEGRYRLLLDDEREGGRGLTGLDLAVFDSYTGKVRPCATLSGGESFMASISLALGLADSIQARSGGVRLDAVFIDEGFGSLDDSSLDKALGILDEIRDHRMVGLISHVAEMRSRIPSRLEIVKSNIGSKLSAGNAFLPLKSVAQKN